MKNPLRILLAVLLISAGGCVSRTAKAGPDEENISAARTGAELRDINFSFDSSQLDSLAKEILRRNAEWLKANPSVKVQIEGHSDERGTGEYNLALAAKRAQAAHEYLATLGIEPGRLGIVSYGEEVPLDGAQSEEAWAKNRRVHFSIKGE